MHSFISGNKTFMSDRNLLHKKYKFHMIKYRPTEGKESSLMDGGDVGMLEFPPFLPTAVQPAISTHKYRRISHSYHYQNSCEENELMTGEEYREVCWRGMYRTPFCDISVGTYNLSI